MFDRLRCLQEKWLNILSLDTLNYLNPIPLTSNMDQREAIISNLKQPELYLEKQQRQSLSPISQNKFSQFTSYKTTSIKKESKTNFARHDETLKIATKRSNIMIKNEKIMDTT